MKAPLSLIFPNCQCEEIWIWRNFILLASPRCRNRQFVGWEFCRKQSRLVSNIFLMFSFVWYLIFSNIIIPPWALCRPSGGWPSRPDRTREQCPWNPTPKIKLHPDQLRPSYIQSLDSKQILNNFWIWNKWNWLKCALPIILSQPQSWWKALLGFISPFTSIYQYITSIYQHTKTEIYQCLDDINDDYEEESYIIIIIIWWRWW